MGRSTQRWAGQSRPDSGTSGLAFLFRLDGSWYAIPLATVERVARMVAITRVPDAPETVLGVVNVSGSVVPVLDLRRRLGHGSKPLDVDDRLVLLQAGGSRFAVAVDEVGDLTTLGDAEPPPAPLAEGGLVTSTLRHEGKLVLILDPGELDIERWRPPSEEGDRAQHSAPRQDRKHTGGRKGRSGGSRKKVPGHDG